MPILSMDGAVVVPKTVNGVEGAAELAPHAPVTTVIDENDYHFPADGVMQFVGVLGTASAWRTRLRSLTLGVAAVRDLEAGW